MTRIEVAFSIFPSLSAGDSQNRPCRPFRFGMEFVFLKKAGASLGPTYGSKAEDGHMLEMGSMF
jgi:hypothetical protein